jgi:hypothetical protein
MRTQTLNYSVKRTSKNHVTTVSEGNLGTGMRATILAAQRNRLVIALTICLKRLAKASYKQCDGLFS